MSWWNPSSWGNKVDDLEQYIPVAGPWLQQANRSLGLIGNQNQSQGNSVDDLIKRMQTQSAQSGNNTSPIAAPNGMSGVDLLNHLYQQQNGGGALSKPNPSPAMPNQTASPLDTLLGDLYKGLGAGQPGMMSPAQIKAQAQKQVNAQYDPQIQAILNQISGTKKTTAANQKKYW
jgi:hypothetical protein